MHVNHNCPIYELYIIAQTGTQKTNFTGPTWVLSAPDGPHVGPMNLVIRDAADCSAFEITMLRVTCILYSDNFRHNYIITLGWTNGDFGFDTCLAHPQSKDHNTLWPNGNIYRVTGSLWGEFTSHRWIPLAKASDAELWCFLWAAPEHTFGQTIETSVIWDAVALIMTSL